MGSIIRLVAKIVWVIVKEGGPTGPPPGSQAYKIYVGSIRVKECLICLFLNIESFTVYINRFRDLY